MYMYILHLRREDATLVTPCSGLSITTTIAGKWLNSLIFHNDINFITADNHLCWHRLKMSCDDHSFSAKNFWEVLSSS